MLNKLLTIIFVALANILVAQVAVSGVVLDETNLPMIGLTVMEAGTNNGTITDIDGKWELQVAEESSKLTFSFVGYKSTTINANSAMEFQMVPDTELLDEIIVVGYGTQKKKVVTGAISKVNAEALEDKQVDRLESALKGRTSGVRVTTESGQPGAASTIRIRGTTTLGNSDPLFVVDGIVINGGIDFLSPNDIESIEVLKDAASASIYGARSANGVVLITTKEGINGPPQVNYNSYYAVSNPWRKLSLLNGTEYATLMNESFAAAGQAVPFSDPTIYGEGTDWQDAIFSKNVPTKFHEVSLKAGGEISRFYGTFSYFDAEGIIAPEKSNYKRYNFRLNNTTTISEKIKFGATVAYAKVKAKGIGINSEFGSPLSRAINLDPLTPIYETDPAELSNAVYSNFPVVSDENGVFGISNNVSSEVLNPLAALAIRQDLGWSDKIVSSSYLEVEPITGLKLRTSIGADLAFWGNENFNPVHYLNASTRNDINDYSRSQNRGLVWLWENTASYELEVGDHSVTALVGNSAQKEKGEGIGGAFQDIPVDNIEDASLAFAVARENQSFFGYEYQNTLASVFGRLTYNFKERYLLTATLRRDGSSRFGLNNLYGTFPAISVGWNISDEDFFKVGAINYLKLRASWGMNGNDRIGDFLFLPQVRTGANYVFGLNNNAQVGTVVQSLANPDLKWEETRQSNIGIDVVLFKDVKVTLDAYQKVTTGILLEFEVPGFVGFGSPTANVGELENRGIELDVDYQLYFANESVLGFGGNVSYNENEVTFITPDKDFLPGARFGPQGLEMSRIMVGQPVGVFFGYKTDGLFQNQAEVDAYANTEGMPIQPEASPGDFKFVDVNGDGAITEEDRTVIGDPTPNWTYGAELDYEFKNFTFSIVGQGVGGNDIFRANRRFDLQMANLPGAALERWTGEGTSNTYPRLVANDPNKNFSRSSDFYIENGSFFRIRNLQIAYTLPSDFTERVRMSKCKLYFSVNNAFTFTKYKGFDPEIGGESFGIDRGIYPIPRQFLVGMNVTFK